MTQGHGVPQQFFSQRKFDFEDNNFEHVFQRHIRFLYNVCHGRQIVKVVEVWFNMASSGSAETKPKLRLGNKTIKGLRVIESNIKL